MPKATRRDCLKVVSAAAALGGLSLWKLRRPFGHDSACGCGRNSSAVLAALLACLLAGCHTIEVKEEARTVRLVFSEQLVTKCSFRGDVIGSEGRWFNSWLIPNDSLSYSALNDLRNNGHALGADTIYVPGIITLFRTSVTIIGQAYRCL